MTKEIVAMHGKYVEQGSADAKHGAEVLAFAKTLSFERYPNFI